MGFNSVFHTLQELFPQVDVRILKAVAIEHSKDVNGAVESILFEVLPTIGSPGEVLFTSGDDHKEEETILLRHQGAVEANTRPPSETRSEACDVACGTDHTSDTFSVKSTFSDEAVAGSMVSSARGENDLEEVFLDNDKEDVTSFTEHQEVNLLDDASSDSLFAVLSSIAKEVAVVTDHSTVASHSDIHGSSGETAYVSLPPICRESHPDSPSSGATSPSGDKLDGSFSSIGRGNHQDDPVSNTSSPEAHRLLTTQEFELPAHEEKLDSMCSGNMSDKDVNNIVSECKEPDSTSSLASSVEPLMFETVNKCHPATIGSRSGQTISTDFLEDFISDAKNNKKTLLVAMESVLNKLREVELQEKAAEQAKEEASRAGSGILTEVENLKEKVHQAKIIHEMHAGEVHGEKSILATEARELQTRLLNLSNERDKSLSIIDEIQRTLEERLAAAEAEKEAAEKEKIDKEESAHKALDEQILIMDKMTQETKKLQQEAEENAKLREFLVERGRIVDTLQGEISVICEDVKLLKERIDERLPISRSLSSSRSSTSSSLSMRRVSPDPFIRHNVSCDSLNMRTEDQQLEGDQSMDMKSCVSQTASLDDEWVLFFKDETELCR